MLDYLKAGIRSELVNSGLKNLSSDQNLHMLGDSGFQSIRRLLPLPDRLARIEALQRSSHFSRVAAAASIAFCLS